MSYFVHFCLGFQPFLHSTLPFRQLSIVCSIYRHDDWMFCSPFEHIQQKEIRVLHTFAIDHQCSLASLMHARQLLALSLFLHIVVPSSLFVPSEPTRSYPSAEEAFTDVLILITSCVEQMYTFIRSMKHPIPSALGS